MIRDEGIALRASDIDVVYLHGYGFPRYRGGQRYHSATLGLRRVHDAVVRYHRTHGEFWTPAPLLGKVAEQGKGFHTLDAVSATGVTARKDHP